MILTAAYTPMYRPKQANTVCAYVEWEKKWAGSLFYAVRLPLRNSRIYKCRPSTQQVYIQSLIAHVCTKSNERRFVGTTRADQTYRIKQRDQHDQRQRHKITLRRPRVDTLSKVLPVLATFPAMVNSLCMGVNSDNVIDRSIQWNTQNSKKKAEQRDRARAALPFESSEKCRWIALDCYVGDLHTTSMVSDRFVFHKSQVHTTTPTPTGLCVSARCEHEHGIFFEGWNDKSLSVTTQIYNMNLLKAFPFIFMFEWCSQVHPSCPVVITSKYSYVMEHK